MIVSGSLIMPDDVVALGFRHCRELLADRLG